MLCCIGGTFQRGNEVVTRIWGRPGAQTIGAVQCYADESEYDRDDLHVHENTHIVEAFVCGMIGLALTPVAFAVIDRPAHIGLALGGFFGVLLYMLLYGVFFLRFYLTQQADERPGWEDDYRRNPMEAWAYDAQGKFALMPMGDRAKVWS